MEGVRQTSPRAYEASHLRKQTSGAEWLYSRQVNGRCSPGSDHPCTEEGRILYVAYVDLKAVFDSIDRNALFNLLKIIGVPENLVSFFRALYTGTISCVRCDEWNAQ